MDNTILRHIHLLSRSYNFCARFFASLLLALFTSFILLYSFSINAAHY